MSNCYLPTYVWKATANRVYGGPSKESPGARHFGLQAHPLSYNDSDLWKRRCMDVEPEAKETYRGDPF